MTAPFTNNFKYQNGFTVVEFLVVFTISAILIAVALPAINSFNTNQVLKTTTQELKSNLRQAQNNAMSGVKDCAVGGDESTTTLLGWYVRFNTTTYTIAHHCYFNDSEQNNDYSSRTYQLKGVTNVSIVPANAVILFKPVAKGVAFYTSFSGSFDTATPENVSKATITLTGSNLNTSIISISSSGEINVER